MARIEEYTQEEFSHAKRNTIRTFLCDPNVAPTGKPHAVLLGGQSGAGKTTLHGIHSAKFKHNVISINGDEYRSKHPRYRLIDKEYGIEMPAYTAKWASQMVESVIFELSKQSYNLIIEGTLRTSTAPMKTATLLKERGYGVSLAVMAVKPEISLISCQLRYEKMRIAGTVPRAVDPAHHMTIVENIVENMSVLESSGLFDEIGLYARSRECLFNSKNSEVPASEALKEILFGPWSSEELTHYSYLQNELNKAKQTSTPQK